MDPAQKIAFFDFDGVIADTFAAAFIVNKMVYPRLGPDDYRKWFAGNIYETTDRERFGFTPGVDFFGTFRPLLLRSSIFPGMAEVLHAIAQRYLLAIISSTPSDLITEFLKVNRIDGLFPEILGSDIHTSKVKKIRMVMEKFSAAPADCVFITDTLGDIREAHHLGLRAIGVTWGYQPREMLEPGSPFMIVETPRELPPALKQAVR